MIRVASLQFIYLNDANVIANEKNVLPQHYTWESMFLFYRSILSAILNTVKLKPMAIDKKFKINDNFIPLIVPARNVQWSSTKRLLLSILECPLIRIVRCKIEWNGNRFAFLIVQITNTFCPFNKFLMRICYRKQVCARLYLRFGPQCLN